MKTLGKISILVFFLTFGIICCNPNDDTAVVPITELATPFHSKVVYYNPDIDWSSTEIQIIDLNGGGSCKVGQFCQFEIVQSHNMNVDGNSVRWLDGSFTITGTEDNSITGVYEGYGTIEDGSVSIDIVFYPQEGCGDFCNVFGQINGTFSNGTYLGVYELILDGTIYHNFISGS